MRDQRTDAPPFAFAVLNLPQGIVTGFVAVTLPFLVTRAGLSVATAASIVAVGLLPLALRFLWAPLADLTLTFKAWYRIGVAGCVVCLLALTAIPIREDTTWWLAAAAFGAFVGVTLVVLPLYGLMALAVGAETKGRAAGWYQAGNLGGTGLAGGAGVWVASHTSSPLAAGALVAAACAACLVGLRFVPEPPRAVRARRPGAKVLEVGRDMWAFARSPRGALSMVFMLSPVGVGAMSNLWSAVAPDWSVSDDTVAWCTGGASAAASAAGCLAGGWWADRADRWTVFLATGGVLSLVGIALAAAPRTPVVFVAGTLAYAFVLGLCCAAYSALILEVIRRGAASTKCSVMNSLGNVPNSYMTAFNGWTHDRWNATVMLGAEALLPVAVGVAFLVALGTVRRSERDEPEGAQGARARRRVSGWGRSILARL